MAMAMTMAMTRTRTRICCLSGFSALSGGKSKPLCSVEQQPKGGGIQDVRPPPLYYGCAAYDSRPSVSSFQKWGWEEGMLFRWEEGVLKPLWSLKQHEPPLPSGGGIQDDRPAYYGDDDRPAYYDVGVQDDRPAYYAGDRPAYYDVGIQDDRAAYYGDDRPAYYGGGIQDDRPGYYDEIQNHQLQDSGAIDRAMLDAEPGTIYPDLYPKNPAYSLSNNPAAFYAARAAYFGDPPPYYDNDAVKDVLPSESDWDDSEWDVDDPPPYSPPPYSPYSPPPPPPPTPTTPTPTTPAPRSRSAPRSAPPCLKKYVDMGLLRPWLLPPIYPDGTPPPRSWWEAEFKKTWRLPPSETPGVQFDDRPAPQLSMVGSNDSNWEGRLKRFKLGRTFRPYPNYSLEDCVALRVCSIAKYFKYPVDDTDISQFPEQFEYWLDDVQGYSEFMELAPELHSINCLYDLLHYVLVFPLDAFRVKTAELVTTMVHNNPRSQQLVMELDGLKPLWHNFTSDPDVTSRTKALGAISALIRNNKPGIIAFRERNGYAALGDALSSENVWLQREALNLIQYLLHENSPDCNTVTELGLPRMMMHLASSDDAEVRVAALGGLLVLARDEGGNSGQLVKNDDKRTEAISSRTDEKIQ